MVIEWLTDVLAKSAVTGALLAIVGWLFKQQISAWLNKDLERKKAAYVQELEAKKAQYQQDLEMYKVSLIAAAERSKAEAEVKKAVALRIFEKRFKAFDDLHTASIGNCRAFSLATEKPVENKTHEEFTALNSRLEILSNCFDSAEVFLNLDERQILVNYTGRLVEMLPLCLPKASLLSEMEISKMKENCLDAEIAADKMIRGQVERMMTMAS